jgi:hypothetical protein
MFKYIVFVHLYKCMCLARLDLPDSWDKIDYRCFILQNVDLDNKAIAYKQFWFLYR